MPKACAQTIFAGHRTAPGKRPVDVLVTASCRADEPWSIRLSCVDEQAREIDTWSFSRGALFDGLTGSVTRGGVTVQPFGFALLFFLNSGPARRSLVQLDRAEVASFLVRLIISGA
ncbi:SsgA family sporulation/cell division regulator [Streptomyces sp. NPDC087300]|uniref:SsgA family sporulation/cell division regulator n=1 Tax=Streptomyces sp. NPDC087300 TaxID=3365780 RepID=UPI0038257671